MEWLEGFQLWPKIALMGMILAIVYYSISNVRLTWRIAQGMCAAKRKLIRRLIIWLRNQMRDLDGEKEDDIKHS